MFAYSEDERNEELKVRAKVAKSINWKVIDNWREKLGASDNFEMVVDFDSEMYYNTKKLIRRSPFQSHVRLNLDKMIFSGCIYPEDVEQYRNVDTSEEVNDDECTEE